MTNFSLEGFPGETNSASVITVPLGLISLLKRSFGQLLARFNWLETKRVWKDVPELTNCNGHFIISQSRVWKRQDCHLEILDLVWWKICILILWWWDKFWAHFQSQDKAVCHLQGCQNDIYSNMFGLYDINSIERTFDTFAKSPYKQN